MENLPSLAGLAFCTTVLADGCFFFILERTNKDKLTEECWLRSFAPRGKNVCSIMLVDSVAFGHVLADETGQGSI